MLDASSLLDICIASFALLNEVDGGLFKKNNFQSQEAQKLI